MVMSLFKKFIVVSLLVFLWDYLAFLIENNFRVYYGEVNVFDSIFKVLMVFLIFQAINKILALGRKLKHR